MTHQEKKIAYLQTRNLLSKGLSAREVAEKLGITTKAVHQRIHRWKLPHLPQGGRRGEKNHQYKKPEDRICNKNGYIKRYHPEHPFCDSYGYVLEHRMVVEQMIGRFLTKLEVVHHKDHNKANNAPDNLMLFSCQADHVAWEKSERSYKDKIPF